MGWEKHYDAHLYRGDSRISHKVYRDIKKMKINKELNTVEIYMEDNKSVSVDADKYTVEIRTREKWGF